MYRVKISGNFLIILNNTDQSEHARHPLRDSDYEPFDELTANPLIRFLGISKSFGVKGNNTSEFRYEDIIDDRSNVIFPTFAELSTFLDDNLGLSSGGGNGGGVPTQDHIFENAAARDVHFTTNLSELRTGTPIFVGGVDLGGGQFGTQLQEWGGANNPLTYDNTDWVSGGIIGLTEAQIKVLYESNADTNAFTDLLSLLVTSLNNIPNEHIPLKTSAGYVSSGIRRLPNGTILAPEGFQVESSSIEFGDLVTLHENNSFLRLSNNQFPEVSFDLLDSRSRRTAESNRPRQFALIEAQNEFTLNDIEDNTITLNDFTFSYTATLNAQTNVIKFKVPVGEVCTNLRARVYYSTGNQTVIKYLPTKEAWLDGVGGYNFTDGEQEVDSGFSNFRTFVGDQVSIQIQGDVVNLLGTSTNIPYTKIMLQRGEFRNIAYLSDIVVNPPISPSGMFTSFNIDGQSTSVTTPFTLSGNQTFNFSINNPSLFTGNLTILQGDNVLLDTISTTSTSSIISVTSSTLSNVGDNEVFTIRGTNTDGTVVSRTFTIHASGSGQLVYYGLSATNNPASVDLSTLQSIAVGTGVIDINTGTVTDGQYFIILDPSNNAIVSITDDVLQQDVTSLFTLTSNVRAIETVNYNSYVIGPLNADAEGETYTLMLR